MTSDQEQVLRYKQLVLDYEAVGEKVDVLLERNGGHTENMSQEDMAIYRHLASERDSLFNQIKAMEASWLAEDE